MNKQRINTIKLGFRASLCGVLALGLLAGMAAAHGGEEHVTGSVTALSESSVTVKTTAGKSVAVGFDAKTVYTRADQPVGKADIKVGDRIVIHAVEVNEKLVAHTVQIGGATAAKAAAKH